MVIQSVNSAQLHRSLIRQIPFASVIPTEAPRKSILQQTLERGVEGSRIARIAKRSKIGFARNAFQFGFFDSLGISGSVLDLSTPRRRFLWRMLASRRSGRDDRGLTAKPGDGSTRRNESAVRLAERVAPALLANVTYFRASRLFWAKSNGFIPGFSQVSVQPCQLRAFSPRYPKNAFPAGGESRARFPYIPYEKVTTVTTFPGLHQESRIFPIELAMYMAITGGRAAASRGRKP
jgi:hypothetical protein